LKCLYEGHRDWTLPKFIFSKFQSLNYTQNQRQR
jgi:hypothetical protein